MRWPKYGIRTPKEMYYNTPPLINFKQVRVIDSLSIPIYISIKLIYVNNGARVELTRKIES